MSIDYRRTAVLVPCFNEAMTIGKVVSDFKAALPGATVYVFDNCSTDLTSAIARENGAVVFYSPRPGKGNVVRHMFRVIDADYYLMVDGDDTYPAHEAERLLVEVRDNHMDMVVGARISEHKQHAFRRFHKFGNLVITGLIRYLFRNKLTDVLSGYRAFSRHIVQSLPLTSRGFEIETELTLQAWTRDFEVKELQIQYGERPEGSTSKLNTFKDGLLIFRAITVIFKDYKPLLFFSVVALIFAVAGLIAGIFPIMDYIKSRYVYRVPLAILASGLGILSALSFGIGLVLDSTFRYHREICELWRLNLRTRR